MDRTPESFSSPEPETPPIGELFRRLAADGGTLVRQELALFRTELKQNVSRIFRDAGKLATGGFLVLVGVLVLVAALVAFLGNVLGGRYALAALIVGLVFVAAGAAVAFMGISDLRSGSLAPDHAIDSVRNTGEWARAEAADVKAALTTGHTQHQEDRSRVVAVREKIVVQRLDGSRSGIVPSGGNRRDEAPLPLSAPLWKRVAHEFSADDLSNQAAKVAYYFFLSLPPAIMAIFGLTSLFGGQRTADWLTTRLSSALPQQAGGLVMSFVDEVVRKQAPGPLTIGLALALWSASTVFTALEDTLNDAYDVTCDRGWIKRRLIALGVLLACAVLFLAGSVVLLAGPAIGDAVGLGSVGGGVWNVVQWPLSFALIAATFWIVYYVLPNVDHSKVKWTLAKSACIAAALWLLATLAFRIYISHFGSYSKTYGILGTVIVLLLWMYITSLVILLGGEISAEMERAA